MTNALTVYQAEEFEVMQRFAKAMVSSNYFTDAKDAAQAFVKIQAGKELGLPPFAAMTGIHIIQGKPVLGANVIATLIKNDPRYNYRVMEHTAQVCRIEFYENGKPCGVSEFTSEDARRAGTKNMDKFPKNMLFARAISNGAKWYCPGVFGGAPVYTPEEMGLETDEDGVIIEGDFATSAGKGRALPSVMSPDEIPLTGRDDYALHITNTQPPTAESAAAAPASGNGQPAKQTVAERIKPTSAMMRKLHALGVQKFGSGWDDARHELTGKITEGRTRSSADLSYSEVVRLAELVKSFPDFEEDKPLFEDDAVDAHDSEPFGDR